jgi:hypothetical protein
VERAYAADGYLIDQGLPGLGDDLPHRPFVCRKAGQGHHFFEKGFEFWHILAALFYGAVVKVGVGGSGVRVTVGVRVGGGRVCVNVEVGGMGVNVSVGGTLVAVGVTVTVGVRNGVNVRDGVKEGVTVAVPVTVPVAGCGVSVGGAGVNVSVGVKVLVGVRVGWFSQPSTCSAPKPRQ